ncbi:metalloendopeptidase [Coemansia sp. RSA 552]|nr:metalloendopeptidase [Coemansia sp. RSA 552]
MSAPTSKPAAHSHAISFNLTADEIISQARAMIAEEKAVLDAVAAVNKPTFANVIAPMEQINNSHGCNYLVHNLLGSTSTEKDIRDAAEEAARLSNDFNVEMMMREDIYRVVHAVFANKEEMDRLSPEDRRVVEKSEQQFRRAGHLLPKEERSQLAELMKRLNDIDLLFTRNIAEQKVRVLFTRQELAGVPESFFVDRETELVDGVTKYVVTSDYPDIDPLLSKARSERTRRELYVACNTRCSDNIPLLQEAVEKRLRAAKLLGYSSHSEFILETRMARTPQAVLDMETDLRRKLSEPASRDLAELEALKRADVQVSGEPYRGFFSWDIQYYANIVVETRHNVSNEEVRQYFPMARTVRALLDIYQKMLGLHIVKVESPEVWQEDVEMYEVWEAHDHDEFVGHFYLDLYPREGKYSHAAAFTIRSGYIHADGTRVTPAVALVANFPKPTSTTPSLLLHSNVAILMHELGHVFHVICAKTKWARFHGTSVERDFVEAPSQMLENWAWEKSVLRGFAAHHQTNEPIPKDLVANMVAAKNEGAGRKNMRQVFFGSYDMAIHNTLDGNVDVKALYNAMQEEICNQGADGEDVFPVATFGHMMGYDSQYYGYLWSQVFSADMYESRFKKDGIDNEKTGMDYRREILQPGGSRDSVVGLVRFLGRQPNNEAFLRSIGLTP